jgi:hypothetical protein
MLALGTLRPAAGHAPAADPGRLPADLRVGHDAMTQAQGAGEGTGALCAASGIRLHHRPWRWAPGTYT